MKVTHFEPGRENARNFWGEKEQINRIRAIAPRPVPPHDATYPGRAARARVKTVVDARFWMGRSNSATTVYCSVWVSWKDGTYCSGRGSAGGGGYHKESAALAEALESAGFTLDTHFGGSGDSAMDDAICAVARKVGYRAAALI